jgi:hypothetical protein
MGKPPGRAPGHGKHSRHGKHRRHNQQQQAQLDVETLPSASNYLDGYPAVKHLMQQFK